MTQQPMTGEQLRAARKEAGLGRTEFAARLGCTERSLDRYETGTRAISAVLQRAINNLLDELAVSVGQSPVQDVTSRRSVAARKSNNNK